jgi:hypothetical protein
VIEACKGTGLTSCPNKTTCNGVGPVFKSQYARTCGDPACEECACGEYKTDPLGNTYDCYWTQGCVLNLDGTCSTTGPVTPGSAVQGVWRCMDNPNC